jgi:glycine/D-amino acid oxidase-like deaminating enzyme
MRLRTFESFWLLKNGLLYSYPSLQHDIDTELVVVGGGISGALISHALVERGYKVLLLDKRDIAQGSSSATTSMLQYEIDVPLIELSLMIGEVAAAECYQAGVAAIDKLGALIKEHQVDCGFEKKESLYLAHNKRAVKDLHREFEMRKKHNIDVQWLEKKEIADRYGLQSYGAILSASGGSVDAYKLAHELIQLNVKRGMQVCDQTEIEEFDMQGTSPVIRVKEGITVKCKKVIFCTGYETTAMLKENIAKLFYTYACVSETGIRLCDKLKNTLVWNTDSPYLYMRCTDDDRLLVGGEDASSNLPFFQQKIKERKSVKLVKKLKKVLPAADFITDFTWGGTFGSTRDGLPYVGASPEYKHALFVLAFGGNGITFSIQAMDMITHMLEGKTHPLAKYYAFGRY